MSKNRVLLIEPDIVLSKIYQKYLSSNGFIVDIANLTQDAINQIDKNLPDLIILELQFSIHNGYEFLYEMRSYPEWNNIPVILHTLSPAHVINLNDTVKNQLGIVDYLYKPYTSLSKLLFTTQKSLEFAKT